MKTKIIIGLFIGLALVQIAVPLSMIVKREDVLKHGRQFKFRTAPIDPYDAFRGRYVALRIKDNFVTVPKSDIFEYGKTVYALITVAADGFARLGGITEYEPTGQPYIKAKIKNLVGDKMYLDLSIDRYYMEEKAAPRAERMYRKYTQDSKQDAYIMVRIKEGFPVIESLYIGERSIEDVIKSQRRY